MGIVLAFIMNFAIEVRYEDAHIGRLVLFEDEPPGTINGVTSFIVDELTDGWHDCMFNCMCISCTS